MLMINMIISCRYLIFYKFKYFWRVSPVKSGQDRYKNQPRPIENYEPGHSSIAEKETKQWWEEAVNAFDEVIKFLSSEALKIKYNF